MTRPISASAPSTLGRVKLDWPAIGRYLNGDKVQLLSSAQHRQLRTAWQDITHQEDTLDDAILIGLVGGTGVGKSTFINALAGQEVSRSSDRRPTTDRVVVYRHVHTELASEVPARDFAQPEVLHDNDRLEKVVLLDFPDFDSAEESHTQIIRRYLPFLDVVLVVVDDVKYADRRLYELLSTLNHDDANIFLLLNKVDRLENRYREKTNEVVAELAADLAQKLRENSRVTVEPGQIFPIAALPVYQARCRQEAAAALENFSKVESMLEASQHDKYRRAAKERNIESRKLELVDTLRDLALGPDNTSVMSQAKQLVQTWRGSLDQSLQVVPVEILTENERRGARRSYLRRVGPAWGIPFSLVFTLMGELRRRGTAALDPIDFGQRILTHYRSFFESLRNVEARFRTEFIGSKMTLEASPSGESQLVVPGGADQLEQPLQLAVRREPTSPGMRRWLAHAPAALALGLAGWSRIYPVLTAAAGTGDSGVLWSMVKSVLTTLSPTFLLGTMLGVVFVYGATSLVIWLLEVQKLDSAVATAEADIRSQVKQLGQRVVNQLGNDVDSLYDEFSQLEAVLKR